MLEKDIEKKVCDYAKKLGILAYKFTSPNRRSVPDRMFINSTGLVWFIEFKKPGGKLTEGQIREIERLESRSVRVYVINEVENGKKLVDEMVKE